MTFGEDDFVECEAHVVESWQIERDGEMLCCLLPKLIARLAVKGRWRELLWMNRWHLLQCGWHRLWDDYPNHVEFSRHMFEDSINFQKTIRLVVPYKLLHLDNGLEELFCKVKDPATDFVVREVIRLRWKSTSTCSAFGRMCFSMVAVTQLIPLHVPGFIRQIR